MKICQVRNDFIPPAKDSQGAERVVESLCRGLMDMGYDVILVPDGEPKEPYDIPVSLEVPKDCDIIHFHGWYADNNYDSYGIPWVATPHCGGMETNRKWLDSADDNPHIICVSNFVAKRLNCHGFVWTCSRPDDFIFDPKKDDYFLWMAGTDWGESKGLFSTIRLAKKLRFNLRIAGSGKNQHNINLVKSHCDDKIKYLGSINGKRKAEVLSKAKALILLTQVADACPTTIGEAMLSGTPVIGSTNGSLPELIDENVGFLCENDRDVAKAIMKINTINLRACYDYGQLHFSNRSSAKKHIRYYHNMLEYGKLEHNR